MVFDFFKASIASAESRILIHPLPRGDSDLISSQRHWPKGV